MIETGYFLEKAIACRKIVGDKVATSNEGATIRARPILILILDLIVSSRRLFILLAARKSLHVDTSARYTPMIVVRIAVTENEKSGSLTIPGVLNRIDTGSIEPIIAPVGVKAVASAAQPTIKPRVPRDPIDRATCIGLLLYLSSSHTVGTVSP